MESGVDLSSLEQVLAPLSHGDAAVVALQQALRPLRRRQRQDFLNTHMLRPSIRYAELKDQLPTGMEPFLALQGDVVRTDAAYILGVRKDRGRPSYVVATSTCDLIPKRRETITLLQVLPRRLAEYSKEFMANEIAQLTSFKQTRQFYLPPLDDDDDVSYNVVLLDAQAQCTNASLDVIERRASMSLVGWRVFGALLRTLQVREAEGEIDIRTLSPRP